MVKTVLFHRDYQVFTGGHLKLFDYFKHTQSADGYRAEIYMTPKSRPDHLWCGQSVATRYRPDTADILFLGGMDWRGLDHYPGIEERVPVINLIQGLRHASPEHPLFPFLKRRATRICVSVEVATALNASGACNGPIHTIQNGIDHELLPRLNNRPGFDIFICGIKHPDLAQFIAHRLERRGFSVDCLTTPVERPDFLVRMADARFVVLIPKAQEGFYLPALEAMAMGCLVICPDCIGNRSFCINEVTALIPERNAEAIEETVIRANQSPALVSTLRRIALSKSKEYNIWTERLAYHKVLKQLTIQ